MKEGLEAKVGSILRSHHGDRMRSPGILDPGFIIHYNRRARDIGTAILERYGIDGPGDTGSDYAKLIRPDSPLPGGTSLLPEKVTAQ